MKKNILLSFLSLFFFLFTNSIKAQILSAGFLSQGNYSRIRNIENVRRLAYGAGGFLEIKLKDNWRIAPQILYNQIGGNINFHKNSYISDVSYRIDIQEIFRNRVTL